MPLRSIGSARARAFASTGSDLSAAFAKSYNAFDTFPFRALVRRIIDKDLKKFKITH